MIGKPINLMPAELQAILEHKRVLSLLRGVEVGLEEAIEHFVEHVEMDWRLEKQRRDLAEEREEIEKHKFLCSEREGRDIGRSRAAEEWCEMNEMASQATPKASPASGIKARAIPKRVATPFPPRKPSHIGQTWPTKAAAPAISAAVSPRK